MTTAPEPQHVRWDQMPSEKMNSLMERQYVMGQQTTIARIFLAKGCAVPEHSHENEQIAFIVSGTLQFQVGDKTIIVRGGEAFLIPPHVPHSAQALEDTVNIDFFAPPRQDWLRQEDAYLRG